MAEYTSQTALIVVDVQNDFAHPDGTICVEGAAAAIARINEEIALALDGGAAVVYTQDWHPPETPHFERPDGRWSTHCVRDTWGAEFHADLRIVGERIVHKGTGLEDDFSGFAARDREAPAERAAVLQAMLDELGVTRIAVTGLATGGCVRATALDGCALGYETTVILDATAPVDLAAGVGVEAVAEMRAAGIRIE